ncbi:MAG: DsrE family protein [Pseudomonadota bacterium]|nr:MAG: DsrE family protein [Pseudomonadota bacterium]
MKYLFLLNDPPYGTERSYNGLRLAREMIKEKDSGNQVHVFLMGDAAACAKGGQKVAQGYYHIESFLKMLVTRDAKVGVCGTCMDARGLADSELVTGAHRSNMIELAEWTKWADKVMIF